MSDASGEGIEAARYTAFGELFEGTAHRYGYAGAYGYQTDADAFGAPGPFPFLHVGARYYDPATGRFLQRDPIGIIGGLNVYLYAGANPLMFVDPDGLDFWGSVGGGYLWLTGGRHSWLDRPKTVRRVKKYLYMGSLVCAGGASTLPLAARVGAGIVGGGANISW